MTSNAATNKKAAAAIEALIAKQGETPLLKMLLAQAKAGELAAPKRMV